MAISKCDRVEPARLAEVQAQVSELLAPGPYAGARQFPLSSVTGEGIDALRQALLAAEQRVRQRSVRGGFRLAVDRAFAVTGAGVVVTGTALAGRVSAGDTLLLGKAGKPVRVRGLHAQNQAATVAEAGQRVALNIAAERLAAEQVHRGDWLVAEWLHAPSVRVDIELKLLPGETRTFEHFSAVHVHLGTRGRNGPGGLARRRNPDGGPAHVRPVAAQRTAAGGTRRPPGAARPACPAHLGGRQGARPVCAKPSAAQR